MKINQIILFIAVSAFSIPAHAVAGKYYFQLSSDSETPLFYIITNEKEIPLQQVHPLKTNTISFESIKGLDNGTVDFKDLQEQKGYEPVKLFITNKKMSELKNGDQVEYYSFSIPRHLFLKVSKTKVTASTKGAFIEPDPCGSLLDARYRGLSTRANLTVHLRLQGCRSNNVPQKEIILKKGTVTIPGAYDVAWKKGFIVPDPE